MAETDDRLPDDSGSQGNETIDGLDSATEALRRATEGTASGAAPRGMPPKIRLSGNQSTRSSAALMGETNVKQSKDRTRVPRRQARAEDIGPWRVTSAVEMRAKPLEGWLSFRL